METCPEEVEEFMPEKPDYVGYAMEMMSDMYPRKTIEEEASEEFIRRWGGFDVKAFTRVLNEGKGEDKVFAIFARRTGLADYFSWLCTKEAEPEGIHDAGPLFP